MPHTPQPTISEALHEFLQDILVDANRRHISVIADPIASTLTTTVEVSDEDLRQFSALLGEMTMQEPSDA